LQRFKNINSFESARGRSLFSMPIFLKETKKALSPLLNNHQCLIQCNNFNFFGTKEALWQIFFNLIENSIIHGFKAIDSGMIHINIIEDDNDVVINYQDNGCGISTTEPSRIFEPFFTSNRNQDSLGLGLNIINNLITHNFQGRIRLLDSPIGIRYEIILPKLSQD